MKLLACYVNNFGKLHDFYMEFTDGVNVLTEPNGWGKSTLASFLKVMLFGMEQHRTAGEETTERRLYAPWQGGVYGGTLDIEAGGRKIRIARRFGFTDHGDSVKVTDISTGMEIPELSGNIGVALFDLDRNSFSRTVFLAQNDCSSGNSEAISSRLGNLAAASDDIENYERAKEVLEQRIARISPKKKNGSLVQRKGMITQLQMELEGLADAEANARALRERMEEKEQLCQEMIEIRSEYARALISASQDSRRKELQQAYRTLCEDLSEKEQAAAAYQPYFPNGVPDASVFADCQEDLRSLEQQKVTFGHVKMSEMDSSNLEQLSRKYAEKMPDEAELEELMEQAMQLARCRKEKADREARLNELEREAVRESGETYVDPTPHRSALVPVAYVMMGFGLLAAVAAGLIVAMIGMGNLVYLMAAVAVVIFVASIVLMTIGSKRNTANAQRIAHRMEERDRRRQEREVPIREEEDELERVSIEIEGLEGRIRSYLSGYPFIDRSLPYQEQLYEIRQGRRNFLELNYRQEVMMESDENCRNLTESLQQKAEVLGLTYDENFADALGSLSRKVAEYTMLWDEVQMLRSRKQAFEEENDLNELFRPQDALYPLEELHGMIYEADEQIEALRASIQQYARQMEDLQQQLDLMDEKEAELRELNHLQEQEAAQYEIMELTDHYLQKSKKEFTNRYMGPITNAFSKYYEMLTGEASDQWMIDANLGLKLKEQGAMRETQSLSTGYQDLLGICMRVSMVNAMYKEEKPFLIFDDPFVNLDNRKLENGKKLLTKLGNEYQIIYFTCHGSRQILPGQDA